MLGLGSEFCALLRQESQLCGVPPASVAAFRLGAQYSVPDPARKPFLAADSQVLPSTWRSKPIWRACGSHTLFSNHPGNKGTGTGNPEPTCQSTSPSFRQPQLLSLPKHFSFSVFMSLVAPSPSRGMPRTVWGDCTPALA